MTPSPASRYPHLDGKLILPGSGGNLARVLFDAPSASAGLLSFVSQQFQNLLRQFTNAGGVFSFSSSSAGAASRQAGSLAKSRPHVIQVNHVTHVGLPLVQSRKQTNRGDKFHHAGKSFHDSVR